MSTSNYFSFPQRWTAQDLANAMPQRLRLSRLLDFDACRDGTGATCANASSQQRRARHVSGYLHIAALPRLFRVS